jgi:transposase
MSASILQFWTNLLRLPDYEVVYCQEESDLQLLRMTVTPLHAVGICPHCGKVSETIHQTRTREHIKDLSISNYSVDLNVRVYQFECLRCGRCFTPPIPFLAEGAHATERFLERAAQLIRKSDLTNAAAFLGVPERTLGNWYYDYLQRRPAVSGEKSKPIRHLGIDELAFKNRHRRYVAVIVDHDNQRVLDVLENREKSTVLAYLKKGQREGSLTQVEEVTTDMWDAYVEAAKEAFGNSVAITIDRFHVMKNFQECMSKARRDLQRRLSDQERRELKGSRWLWMTNPENLAPEDLHKLTALKKRFPSLRQLADQREALRTIFEDKTIKTPSAGRRRLQAWMEQVRSLGLTALDTFCKTLGNWMDGIANYFRNRGSNGRAEGLNHGLRAILWRAYGMVNFANFRLRVLHCFGLSLT